MAEPRKCGPYQKAQNVDLIPNNSSLEQKNLGFDKFRGNQKIYQQR